MRLSFHGADRAVTGSCHLVECAGRRILVDCGLFQGGREAAEENAAPFDFDPAAIDVVLLTHAHLDHCGRLPLLVKRGFRGEIVTTSASRELTRIVLLDSARLQEEDADRRARVAARRGNGKGNGPAGPLYTVLDAANTQDQFGRVARYGEPIDLGLGIRATFIDAGHILGSASIVLDLSENGRSLRLVMSGDIGNSGRPLLRDATPPPKADVVVMESTYGDRLHKPIGPSVEEFYGAITETFARGGNVLIPSFALERAQELLYFIKAGVEASRLPPSIQVFLDSPMAISATEVFRRHPECLEPEVTALFRDGRDPFDLPGLHMVHDKADSVRLNAVTGGAVIIAGSGMATGGRILHHLRHHLWRPASSVAIVGFAAAATVARQIVDGAPMVRIFGEEIPVKARVYTINGFSAHADQAELVAWHRPSGAARTFLVHGEETAMAPLAALLSGTVAMPAKGEGVAL